MSSEVIRGERSELPSRTDCYLAFNYVAQNEFALSAALAEDPLSLGELEQEIAEGVASEYPHFFEGTKDPGERGRTLLRDASINPAVTDLDSLARLHRLFTMVDRCFDGEQEWNSNQCLDN